MQAKTAVIGYDQMIRERNRAIRSGDTAALRAYARKYGVDVPEDDAELWARAARAMELQQAADRYADMEAKQYRLPVSKRRLTGYNREQEA